MRSHLVIALALIVGASCAVDAPAPAPPATSEVAGTLGARHLQRLTRGDYERTLRDLLGDDAIDAASAELATLPDDGGETYEALSHGVSSDHIDGYFRVADRLARYFVERPATLIELDACFEAADLGGTEFDTTRIDEDCARSFIGRFGARAFRRPLGDAEQTRLLDSYRRGAAIDPVNGIELVLIELLISPAFLYRLELDGEAVPGRDHTFALTGHELATRLSYLAWGTAPDAELRRAASDGELDDQELLAAQVDRLFADDRARAHVSQFFAAWLGYEALPEPSPALAGSIEVEPLRKAMQSELDRLVDHHVLQHHSDFAELLTSNVVFVDSPELAAVYGIEAGVGPLTVDDSERDGLLTRAGLLMASGRDTHPIQRAAYVRRMLLCEPQRRPDPTELGVNSLDEPPFDPTRPARERWQAATSAPACNACHLHLNPVGFALEGYDNLGRFRRLEPVFDPDTDELVAELPIDTQVEVLIDGVPTPVADAAALGRALGQSEQAERCFARQWFRFVEGRVDGADDERWIDRMLTDGAALIDTMKAIALSPEFRVRRVEVEP